MVAFSQAYFLSERYDGTLKLQLWVRHIETGRQSRIDIDTAAPVIVVGFGPAGGLCLTHSRGHYGRAGRP
jgi:hypothetical protein